MAGFEGVQALEHLCQRFLDQVLRFQRPTRGGRQPAVRPAPQPGAVAIEQGGNGRLIPRARGTTSSMVDSELADTPAVSATGPVPRAPASSIGRKPIE